MAKRMVFDALRSIAYTSISGTYAAIGTAVAVPARIMCLTNTTDVDMIVSDDSTVSAGKLLLPAGSFKLFDITSNMNPTLDDTVTVGEQVTFYVKQVASPMKGSVYLEIVYAR